MTWTELLTSAVEENFMVTDALVAQLTDDDLSWKPDSGTNWMTTGQLLMHLTQSCGFCCRGFLTGEWGMPEGSESEKPAEEMMLPPAEALPSVESVQQARDLLEVDRKLALEMIAQAGEDKLENEKTAAPWEPGNQRTLGVHFHSMVQHLQSHKAQLYYYLKLMGHEVNTQHLWGM